MTGRCRCGHVAGRHNDLGNCTVYSRSKGDCTCQSYDDGTRRRVTSLLRVDGRVVVPFRATVGRGEGSARTTSPRLLTEQTAKARHAESGSKRAALQESPSVTPRLSSPPLRLLSGGEDLLVLNAERRSTRIERRP